MRLRRSGRVAAVFCFAAIVLGYNAVFSVYQSQQSLVVRLGKPVQIVTDPGLHFKLPLIDRVITLEKRILDLEMPAQEIIASDQKRLVISAFARYRILDPLKFYQTVGSIPEAKQRLSIFLISTLRRILGQASFIRAVRDERGPLMAAMRDQFDKEAATLGVLIIDVRIQSANLPRQNSEAIYHRMQTERQREAAELRAQGSQRSLEIRARADRDVTVLIAEAMSKSEQLRGEGDAERARIFADGFGKDIEFFTFYRSMQAYETGLRHDTTRMLLQTKSPFFRYFVSPSGKGISAGSN